MSILPTKSSRLLSLTLALALGQGLGAQTLTWKGHTWNVTNGGMAGVAEGSASNVFVDANGYLHLKITKSGSTWTAAELFSADNMGFGTYQWQLEGAVDNFDKCVVLGLFPYGPAAGIGVDGENELDIEFSKWNGTVGAHNADFTYYPATGSGDGQRTPSDYDEFTISLGGTNLCTARTVWSSKSVTGTIMSGLQPVGTTAGVLRAHTYAPASGWAQKIPQVALPLGMNLWCFGATPASNQEVIIRDFQFIPEGSQPVSHTITASAGAGGTISPSGAVQVSQGASQTFTFTPAAGYAINAITVDGQNKGILPSYVFSNVSAPHTISAAFAPVSSSIGVTIAPKTATIAAGAKLQFSASVTGTTNKALIWTCDYGKVSTAGLYTAPAAAGTYHVRARSAADTTKSDLATITVTPAVAVTISPKTPTLALGATQQFAAAVTGTANTAVKWTCDYGTVSTSGLYKAPLTAGTYRVRATSLADATKSDLATITVGSVTNTNIAPLGAGYTWMSNGAAASDANRASSPAVNDGSLAASVVVNPTGEGGAALWQGAGVVWSAAKTVSSAKFVNGGDDGYGNGYFQAGCRLQFSTDGITWTDSGWTLSPAYPFSASALGATYTFSGAERSGVRGARIVGQTGSSSWSWSVSEVQFMGR